MGKFIKLTREFNGNESSVYLNSDHIIWFDDYYHDGKRTCSHVGIKWRGNEFVDVKETSEEIISLINGETKLKPMDGNFAKAMRGKT